VISYSTRTCADFWRWVLRWCDDALSACGGNHLGSQPDIPAMCLRRMHGSTGQQFCNQPLEAITVGGG
jgi:hypothetical protein